MSDYIFMKSGVRLEFLLGIRDSCFRKRGFVVNADYERRREKEDEERVS